MTHCRLCVAAVLAMVSCAPPVYGGEKKSPPSEERIKTLLDRLASPNPAPTTGEEDPKVAPNAVWPRDYSDDKQKPVIDARFELRKLGTRAFPFLIERWDDKRYSLTVVNGLSGFYRNHTVGKVCRTIIYDQLQPYGYWQATGRDPRTKAVRPRYPEMVLSSQAAAQRWWNKHKDKTLQQMQLEVLDWIIAEEAKNQRKYSNDKDHLQQVRNTLATGEKPLPPGNYYYNERGH
jgi:hypothetical protein